MSCTTAGESDVGCAGSQASDRGARATKFAGQKANVGRYMQSQAGAPCLKVMSQDRESSTYVRTKWPSESTRRGRIETSVAERQGYERAGVCAAQMQD